MYHSSDQLSHQIKYINPGKYIHFCFLLSDRPIATISAPDTDTIEGTEFTLTCNIDALPDDITSYTWWHDEELPLDGENEEALTLTLDHEEHDGSYTCAGANVVGPGDPSQEGYQLKVYCKFNFDK